LSEEVAGSGKAVCSSALLSLFLGEVFTDKRKSQDDRPVGHYRAGAHYGSNCEKKARITGLFQPNAETIKAIERHS